MCGSYWSITIHTGGCGCRGDRHIMKRRENKKPLNSSNNNISLTPVRPTASSSEFESWSGQGLYPADDSRVILERETEEESDFINASYISGYAPGSPKFIASQGPTAATIDDFWLMIWQQKTSSVVMVTNVVEERKHKCDQYWPDDTSTELRYGDITVSMVSADEWADYMVRMLKVEKDGEVRTVKQYHYTSWPDHGVPDSMSPFIFFYKRVKIETAKTTTPIVVHCSAGVGRTGTFIAMNNLLEQAKVEERVNFHQCVKKMRTCRPSMVQTEDQYVFLHQVVSEYLITKEFFCSPSAFAQQTG
ncbi:hypothetical protein EB796_013539 [Bugula neritina]|uniref:protein-tyrosine-phosphatase n=1 Tax=Bugula neritina TaxID=10212 RepID=A0A7J7JR46_BUGNE|nr:hypothetical protein EB796_013539 [Bugula neritina]